MTATSNRLLNQPTVGGDTGVWGPPLNSNADFLDQILSQMASVSFASAGADIALTQAQMQYLGWSLTGTPSVSTVQLKLYQNMQGYWYVNNLTPNPVTVITANVGSVGTTVPPGSITLVRSDGTDVVPLVTAQAIRILTTGNATLTTRDQILIVNKTVGAATTVALPAAGGDFTVKDGKGDAYTNNITVSVTGGATIDGASNYVIATAYQAVRFVYNGTQYNAYAFEGKGTAFWGGVAGGTANALTLTTGQSLKQLKPGMTFFFRTGASGNSSTVTVAVDGLSAVALQKNGSAMASGDLSASTNYSATVDNSGVLQLGGASGGIVNPMTTAGDIIIGGASGTPTRLGKGNENATLTIVSGVPAWSGTNYGYAAGGFDNSAASTVIDRFAFVAAGNAATVGALTATTYGAAGASDQANGYGYIMGGTVTGSASNLVARCQLVAIANSVSVGTLIGSYANLGDAGGQSLTHAYALGGNVGAVSQDTIQRLAFGSSSNAASVGTLTQTTEQCTGSSDTTNGYIYRAGGMVNGGSRQTTIDRVSTASGSANAASVGTLVTAANWGATTQDLTGGYAYFAGGYDGASYLSAIVRFQFVSSGNAASVGNLTAVRQAITGNSSTSYGYYSGGFTGVTNSNVIERLLYTSSANASSVGTLTVARAYSASWEG